VNVRDAATAGTALRLTARAAPPSPPRRLRDPEAYAERPVAETFDLVARVPETGQSR